VLSDGVRDRSRVRVAFMLTPVEFGGAERVCLTLLKNINRQRFDLFPILLTRPWEQDNVFIRELRKESYDYCEVPVALQDKGDFLRFARCYKLVHKLMRGQEFDLLHTNGYFADIVGIPIARLIGLPSLSTCHGFITNTWKYRLYNTIDRIALKFCIQIIAVSEGIKEHLIDSGLNPSQVRVIENAVDCAWDNELSQKVRQQQRAALTINEEEFVLGYVGRLSKEKGLRYLFTAFSQLVEKGLSIKTIIIGDGPQRKELEHLAEKLKIKKSIIFAGFQEDMRRWFLCMDAFVLPSLTEGTPMALLEAMACRVPVIATSVGGVPQVIERVKTGILISPGKPEEITNAVLTLCSDEMTRIRLAENAYSLIKAKYGIGAWISRIEAEYLKLRS
jgi:glycosyltransferase involved in cell wall biosynthesis